MHTPTVQHVWPPDNILAHLETWQNPRSDVHRVTHVAHDVAGLPVAPPVSQAHIVDRPSTVRLTVTPSVASPGAHTFPSRASRRGALARGDSSPGSSARPQPQVGTQIHPINKSAPPALIAPPLCSGGPTGGRAEIAARGSLRALARRIAAGVRAGQNQAGLQAGLQVRSSWRARP